jgi:hypothetical protein
MPHRVVERSVSEGETEGMSHRDASERCQGMCGRAGTLVTPNGRPWPCGSLLRDHSSLRGTLLVRKHISAQAVPISLSNAIDRLDDLEGENLTHQDIQHDNVAARHLENMESGWWQEESEKCHHNSH